MDLTGFLPQKADYPCFPPAMAQLRADEVFSYLSPRSIEQKKEKVKLHIEVIETKSFTVEVSVPSIAKFDNENMGKLLKSVYANSQPADYKVTRFEQGSLRAEWPAFTENNWSLSKEKKYSNDQIKRIIDRSKLQLPRTNNWGGAKNW